MIDKEYQRWIRESLRRNKHLYEDDKIEGYDYLVCPVTEIRCVMLTKKHIERRCKMSVEEFDNKFPHLLVKCSQSRIDNIKKGIHEVGPDDKTNHQRSVESSRISREMVGDDGLTPNQRIGINSRATHLSRIDENGLNGYQRISSNARPKQIETMAKQGRAIYAHNRKVWEAYRWFCIWWSNQYRKGIIGDRKTGKAGTEGAYHMDHQYSIFHAFRDKVSPFAVSHIANLTATPWQENVSKNRSSDITIEELFERTGYTLEQSRKEFDNFISIITETPTLTSAETLIAYRKGFDDTKIYSK